MARPGWLIGAGAIAAAVAASAASVATRGVTGTDAGRLQTDVAARTVWNGAFTAEQAARGERAYTQSCASCHKADLLGDNSAPALVGPEFAGRWKGSTADDMVQTIRRSMPQDAPDSLSQRVYVDLIAYLLKANGGETGSTEMPIERDALKQIAVTPRE